MTEFRHHRANRDVQIVLVPVPAAGTPEPLKWAKPGKYPLQRREAWRPARSIPVKQRQAGRLVEIMRDLDRREVDARSMLKPNPALLHAWLHRCDEGDHDIAALASHPPT
jgi:hypothetical protein